MKKLFAAFAAAISFFNAAGVAAAPKATAEEAVAMVKKAGAYFEKNGKEKTFAEINNPKGQFIDREMYIVAFSTNGEGIGLANGGNQKLIGKKIIDIRDADGKYIIRDVLAVGTGKEGKGWIEYKWVNPVTNAIEDKRTYVERFGDVIFVCGIYK
jgi:signal transduction histidine kinase